MPQDRRPNSTPDGAYDQRHGDWFHDSNIPPATLAREQAARETAETAQRERFARAERYEQESRERVVVSPETRRRLGPQEDRSYLAGQPGTVAYLQQMVPGLSWEAAQAALAIRTRHGDITEAEAIAGGIINAQRHGLFQDSQERRDEKIIEGLARAGVTWSDREEASLVSAVNQILEGRGNHTRGNGERGDAHLR